jgi:hypothetical protein
MKKYGFYGDDVEWRQSLWFIEEEATTTRYFHICGKLSTKA